MRVAIYARFSSDLQDPRSIADQIGAARDHAARQSWQVVAEFCDAANGYKVSGGQGEALMNEESRRVIQ
jgi:DNA invertase Pin-like site-specific DNA recombinase